MIAYHVAITTAEDYVAKREPHRKAHLDRLMGLRERGVVIGGGPVPDGSRAEIFYRVQQAQDLTRVIEEDPYWTGGAWTAYDPRSFAQFIEPWELPPLVTDGSRKTTIVEGVAKDPDMASFALIEARGAGRMAFGGFFPGGRTLALMRSADPAEAVRSLEETGFWQDATLTARLLLYVL
ncbi:MAG TPA: YciI family protein [Methylomirabilota bacterium]|nr:YciI family protein [Methylomirabilota bacterium]